MDSNIKTTGRDLNNISSADLAERMMDQAQGAAAYRELPLRAVVLCHHCGEPAEPNTYYCAEHRHLIPGIYRKYGAAEEAEVAPHVFLESDTETPEQYRARCEANARKMREEFNPSAGPEKAMEEAVSRYALVGVSVGLLLLLFVLIPAFLTYWRYTHGRGIW